MKRKTDNFNKFYNKKNNAAIKEAFKQEKKAAKKERKEAIERHFEEKRKAREARLAAPPQNSRIAAGRTTAMPKGSVPVQTPKGAAPHDPNALPLNKYIAHGGICSRRDAAELIRQGKVEVNGKLVTEPGTKVYPTDVVNINGKKVTISRNFVYILLNKPKDYITTTDDPQGRKTVLDLIRQATTERVYPVGRLDRNTSGVLLLTNDGDLSQKLAHPSHEIKKIYHVTLDKPLTKTDFDKIVTGVQLEDGLAHVDVLAYADPKDKTQIGLEIHSGRNRIVRRIFEHLGYDVRGLDRVMYAGLTKKNVQRGHWRLLTEKEIRILKYLNASFRGSLSAPKGQKGAGQESMPADEVTNSEAAEKPQVAGFNKSKVSHDQTGTGYQRPKGGAQSSKGPRAKKPYAGASGERKAPRNAPPGDRKASFGPGKSKAPFDRKPKSFGSSERDGAPRKDKPYGTSEHGAGPRKAKPYGTSEHGASPRKPKSFGSSERDGAPRKAKSYGTSEHGAGPRKTKPYGTSEHGASPRKPKSFGSSERGAAPRKDRPYGTSEHGAGPRKAKPYGTSEHGAGPRKAKPYGTSEHGASPRKPKSFGSSERGAAPRKSAGPSRSKPSGSGSPVKKSRRPR